MPELGLARENIVFVSGIGCSVALPVLHEHLRHALDPRPRAGDRDRPGHLAAGPVGVGRHRRRRRAVDRRQPPDPRAAPQRQPEDPAVQQPDLRPDQGPVLARPPRSARSPSRRRWARWTRRSTRSRWRSAPRRPSSPARIDSDRKHLTSVLRAAAAHQGTALVEIYQNCNIFNDGAFDVLKDPETARRGADPAGARPADPLRRRRRQGRRPRPGHRRPDGRRRHRRTTSAACSSTTRTPPRPSTAFALSRLADPDTLHHTPIGVFRDVTAPGLRHRDGRPARPGRRAEGQGRPRRAAHRQRHLDRRRLNRRSRYAITVPAAASAGHGGRSPVFLGP